MIDNENYELQLENCKSKPGSYMQDLMNLETSNEYLMIEYVIQE